MTIDTDPPRCPRCERRVRLTKRGLIGRHDKGAYHRTACRASGLDYATELDTLLNKGRQDA